MTKENLNTKKVSEKSGNFLILAQTCLAVAGILYILRGLKTFFFSSVIFLARFARSALLQIDVRFKKINAQRL